MTTNNKIFLFVSALAVGVGVMLGFQAPQDAYMGLRQKMMYVHVPMAFGMGALLVWFSIGSWLYLALKLQVLDSMNRATASVGILAGCLALATGMLWGRTTWGVYWTWDPRLVSTALMVVYLLAAHLLRESLEDSPRGPLLTAGLGSLAIVGYAVIHLSVNWWTSLHQQATVLRPDGPKMQGDMLRALMVCVFSWLALWFSLVALRTRLNELTRQVSDQKAEAELLEAGLA